MNNYVYANQEECSSGCESGWTLYLEHSSTSSYVSCNDQEHDFQLDGRRNRVFNTEAKRLKQDEEEEEEEEEDEDLSMVSDASSGPPHLHEEEGLLYGGNDSNNGCFYQYTNNIDDPLSRNCLINKKKNREDRRRKVQDQSSLLDDTASSPFFDFSDKSFTVSTSSQPSAENVLEYSQGYSSTQFEVRPPYQEHYHDFFQSSYSGNHLQQNQWFEGKRW